MITRAFKPLAMQRSYSPEKSAAVMADGCLAQASFPTLAHTPPLTMLTHVGRLGRQGARRGVRQLTPSWPNWSAFNGESKGGMEG
jgi:hypothetical protein